MKKLSVEILITLIGKYYYYKKLLLPCQIGLESGASALIRILLYDKFVKFVQRKVEDYKISDNDKRIIESILLYESE